jgi:hypothetical protein
MYSHAHSPIVCIFLSVRYCHIEVASTLAEPTKIAETLTLTDVIPTAFGSADELASIPAGRRVLAAAGYPSTFLQAVYNRVL